MTIYSLGEGLFAVPGLKHFIYQAHQVRICHALGVYPGGDDVFEVNPRRDAIMLIQDWDFFIHWNMRNFIGHLSRPQAWGAVWAKISDFMEKLQKKDNLKLAFVGNARELRQMRIVLRECMCLCLRKFPCFFWSLATRTC